MAEQKQNQQQQEGEKPPVALEIDSPLMAVEQKIENGCWGHSYREWGEMVAAFVVLYGVVATFFILLLLAQFAWGQTVLWTFFVVWVLFVLTVVSVVLYGRHERRKLNKYDTRLDIVDS